MLSCMATTERRPARHDRVVGLALLVGFLVVVGGAIAAYVAGASALHVRFRSIVPAIVGSLRMPAVGPAELVLGAAIIVMSVAFVALLIHDARSGEGSSRS